MKITLRKQGTVLLIEIEGRMDTSMSQDFEKQLLGLIENGETHLVFDFTQVEHVTTNGLRLLLKAFKAVTQLNGRMAFHSLNWRVKRVFEVAGLTMVFRVYETREEAFAGTLYTKMLPVNILKDFKNRTREVESGRRLQREQS